MRKISLPKSVAGTGLSLRIDPDETLDVVRQILNLLFFFVDVRVELLHFVFQLLDLSNLLCGITPQTLELRLDLCRFASLCLDFRR